ncbi:VOC family protein [Streptomyces malaysiensis subsp. malaysiensis]|uniref:VOC family protein n=1 Tax=Streptomyces malaysiensis TaxID=92644 RepID=UPI0024BFB804|nr:VOC family protein [Streptomyces sp. NA07423]WHX15712.1 VOC family protein [Streptomyces sp. NA07423]
MPYVNALGYIGIGAKDLDVWQTFATEILGLQVTRAADAENVDTLFLRMDARHHRIAVRAGEDELSYVGWEVADEAHLDAQVRELESAGVTVKENPQLADVRGVRRLVQFEDPAGFRLELFYGAATVSDPFVSPTGVRFITEDPEGRDLGLGHIVLVVPDTEKMVDFYLHTLGFKVSDYITFNPVVLTFTHVNPRHHSLAFGPASEGTKPFMDHFMLEVEGIDAVGRALDQVRAREISLTATLGRHTNDGMLSFYMKSPSGIGVEYGTEGKLIDDDAWTVTNWNTAAFWGHDRSHPH